MVNAYEQQRQDRIRKNQEKLKGLNVPKLEQAPQQRAPKKPSADSKKRPAPLREPIRRSTRQRRDVDYTEEQHGSQAEAVAGIHYQEETAKYKPVSDPEQVVESAVDPSEGERDNFGRLVFEDVPEFRPTLTPKEVIQAGSFGGIYFNPTGGRRGIIRPQGVDVSHEEFPEDWFEGLHPDLYRATRYVTNRNKYKVKSGQNQAQWEKAGWITAQDPRGWFQWYCRFYQGRRTADDERQIGRWRGVAGEKGRWKKSLVNKVVHANKHWNDASVSPVIRQTLLHWAYELTEADFDRIRAQL